MATDTEIPALLPCPFCGGDVRLEKTIDRREWWGVVCRNTEGLGGTCAIQQRPSASIEAAVTRWNTRSKLPSIWTHRGRGHYIGSCVVVCADSRGAAETLIRERLDECGLKIEAIDVTEIPVENGNVIVCIDGDY